MQGNKRVIEVEEKESNGNIISRSVVGEVKAMCFLTKLPVLCEEQGLGNIEAKLLGGLEVIVVFENIETASKVLKDVDHGLRRWLYKLRRGDSLQRTAGRLTWINILGIPVAGWGEETFRKIAALLGKILCLHNCRLK
ncbi:transposon TX1, partial [Tanacetum coccineum]